MGLREAVLRAKELCKGGRISVYYLDRNGLIEERNPHAKLDCIFSPQILWAAIESLESQHHDEILTSETSNPKIEFKNPWEVKESDFEPILSKIKPGARIGIQAANPSIARQLELMNYNRKYQTAKEKIRTNQQLSQDEERIYNSFFSQDVNGIPRLDFTKNYCRTVNFMFNQALLLAYSAQQRGIEPVLAVCFDDFLDGDTLKLGKKMGVDQDTLERGYQMRIAAFRKFFRQISDKDLKTVIYKESELDVMLCYCDFCNGRACPTRASHAVQKLIDNGCSSVVNFYVEDDGPTGKAGAHYERIERGMLHRTLELKDDKLCCNIYFGAKRAFMVIHAPSREKNE